MSGNNEIKKLIAQSFSRSHEIFILNILPNKKSLKFNMHPVFKTLACSNNNHVPFDIQAKIFSERTHNKPNEHH